ncbi:hypothetical protein ABZ474_53925, partial [Streptomyces mirabilis]
VESDAAQTDRTDLALVAQGGHHRELVSCVVLVVLMVGNSGTVPVIVLAAVVSFVTTELLSQGPGIPVFSDGARRAPRPASSRP